MATGGNINFAGGAQVIAFSENTKQATPFTVSHPGTALYVVIETGGAIIGNKMAKCAIYADSSGSPGALLGFAASPENISAGFITFTLNVNLPTAGTYWAALLYDAHNNFGAGMLGSGANGTGTTVQNSNTYTSGFSNPFGTATQVATFDFCVAVIYTPSDLSAGAYVGEITGGPIQSSVGGSAFNSNQVWALQVVPSLSGQITQFVFYMQKALGSPFVAKFEVWDSTTFMGHTVPNNLLGETAAVTSFNINENTVSLSSPVSVTAGQTYFIGCYTPDLMPTFDASPGATAWITTSSYPTTPNPYPFSSATLASFGAPTFWATITPTPISVSISARVTASSKALPNLVPVRFNTSALWRTDAVPSQTSTYNEGGVALAWEYETVLLPDNLEMMENMIVESDLSMSFLGSLPVVTVTATDTNDQQLNSIGISGGQTDTLWNSFKWNQAPWDGTVTDISSWNIAWTEPLVFKQITITATGYSATGFEIGNLYLKYQVLGYLQQLDSGVR